MSMSLGRCGTCGHEWNALGQAHCGGPKGCHEQFNSTAAFDRHRRDFECIPVSDFAKPMKNGQARLVRAQRASGDVWVTALREVEERA